nr:hypothetical protein [Streptomyces paludis]
MLDDPRTVRVTGDETAAIYRRAVDADAERHPERYGGRPVPEAYCWSNLTSGNGSRALWLLLLPFMVVNLAHWMRPATKGVPGTQRLYGVLVRLVALTLTVLLTAAACEVALDLTAWQCAGSAECVARRSWLGFLAAEREGWWAQPGRRLALASVVPTALVGLLWYLSHRTWSAYESQRPPTDDRLGVPDRTAAPDPLPSKPPATGLPAPEPTAPEPLASDPSLTDGVRSALGRPGFWYGRRLVARLRAAHTAAGFLTVAAALTAAGADHDARVPGAPAAVLGVLLRAALLCCAAVALWVVCARSRGDRGRRRSLDRLLTERLPAASLALLGLSVVYVGWSRPGWVSTGALPVDQVFRALSLAQVVLVVALVVVARRMYRRTSQPRTAMRGLGGPAVAMLACALGGVMTGGVAQWVADRLDGDATPGMGGGPMPGPPVLLSWQASVIPVLLVLLVVPAGVLAVRTARGARALAPLVEREYARERGGTKADALRTRQVAGVRARAALTDSAPRLVGVVSGASLLLGAAAVAGSWASGEVPGQAARGTDSFVEAFAQTAQAIGSWLVGFGFLLFVTWGRRAYRDASARRTIGILWDVGTFWPRAAHPFAPPCYAERAVPDLTWRIAAWTGRTGGRLVLSGHSQGSVLAAAAVWQLRPATRRRVALLTYGSPLERLYGRWFPAYFGAGQLARLSREVHCWRNLWRATDPIGGPVRVPADGDRPEVDRGPLTDPLCYGRTVEHPLPEPVFGHSNYQADPVFAEERAALLDRLPPPLPPRPLPPPRGQNNSSLAAAVSAEADSAEAETPDSEVAGSGSGGRSSA